MKLTFLKKLPKIVAACSKQDNHQSVLHHPHLDTELGELQATDTHIAVRIPVEVEKPDTTGPVDVKKLAIGTGLFAAKKDQPKVEGTFPDLKKLWPAAKAVAKPGFRVGIDATLLTAAAKALGSDRLELVFPDYKGDGPDAGRAILVRPKYSTGQITPRTGGGLELPEAIVMPFMLSPLESEIEKNVAKPAAKAAKAAKEPGYVTVAKAQAAKTIPYDGVPDDQLTAGQKSARTKARKAAGLNGTNGTGSDLVKDLKAEVDKAKTRGRGGDKAKAASNGASNGRKKPTWTPEVLKARAAAALKTRRKNERARAKAEKAAAAA